MPENLKQTYQNYTESNQKKLQETGFKSRFSLEEGIRDYVQSYLDTQDPYA